MIIKPLLATLLISTAMSSHFQGFPCIHMDFDTSTYIDITPLAKLEYFNKYANNP